MLTIKTFRVAAAALLLLIQQPSTNAEINALRGKRDLQGDDTTPICTSKCSSREYCVLQDTGATECVCKPGYFSAETGGRQSCQDEDECKLDYPCPLNNTISFCVDMDPPMRFKCGCLPGFLPVLPESTDGFTEPVPLDFRPITCVDKNECDVDAPCDLTVSTCVNTFGSFVCDCFEGFRSDGKNKCIKVEDDSAGEPPQNNQDACENKCNSESNQVCAPSIQNPGTSACLCEKGFKQIREGSGCRDVDECSLGLDNCDENAKCDNIPGTFLCTCASGFFGTGIEGRCTATAAPITPATNAPAPLIEEIVEEDPVVSSVGGSSFTAPVVPLLYISEWISGTVTGIEFCNPSQSQSIDLSGYTIEVFADGDIAESPSITYVLNADVTVEAGDAYTLVDTPPEETGRARRTQDIGITSAKSTAPEADAAAGPIGTGNDLIVLKKNGVVVDSLGQLGVAGDWGNQKTLRRKPDNEIRDTVTDNVFDPATAYNQYGVDNFFGFGSCESPSVLHSVVVNEVLPDPNDTDGLNFDTDGDSTAEDEDEFIEIYNIETLEIDISGIQFWDAAQDNFFTVPDGSKLGAGGFLVVIQSSAGGDLPSVTEGSLAFEAGDMALANTGENLVLYDATTEKYIQMKYGTSEPDDNVVATFTEFPQTATLIGSILDYGSAEAGVSIALSPDGDTTNVVSHNTIGFGSTLATPGTANIDAGSVLLSIVFNEVLPDPTASSNMGFDTNEDGSIAAGDEFIEMYNIGTEAIDIGGLQFWDATQGNYFTVEAGVMLGAGGFLVLVKELTATSGPSLASGGSHAFAAADMSLLDDANGESLVLYDPATNQYIQAKYGTGAATDAGTYSKFPVDATLLGNILDFGTFTPGVSVALSPNGNTAKIVKHDTLGDGSTLATPGNSNIGENSVLKFIVFNEVLPDPTVTEGGFDTNKDGTIADADEFIEIYNTGLTELDVSELQFWDATQGNYFTIESGTKLGAKRFLVLVKALPDPTVLAVAMGSHAFEAEDLSLLNGGENLVLYDGSTDSYIQGKYGTLHQEDAVTSGSLYDGFSSTATLIGTVQDLGNDADGISIALSPDGDTTNPVLHNTIGDGTVVATPGSRNIRVLQSIMFNEIRPDPNSNSGLNFDTDRDGNSEAKDEFVEIYNSETEDLDVSELQFWDSSKKLVFTLDFGTILGAKRFLILLGSISGGSLPDIDEGSHAFVVAGLSLANGGENCVLYDPSKDEYIQMKYNGASTENPVTAYTGFSPSASLLGSVLDFGDDTDGTSLALSPDGDTSNPAVTHNSIGNGSVLASPGKANVAPA